MDRDPEVLKLYKKGMNDHEIARCTGYSRSGISLWRKRHKLSPNCGAWKRKEKIC